MKNWRQLTIALAALAASAAAAAPVPIRWTVETSRVAPAAIDAYHGETLRLEATLQSYGKPLVTAGETPCIYWQTNGMGTAYWSAPATCSNNVLRADFTPEMDPGSAVVHGFIGLPGEIYRASFTLRFRASPGATPNVLPLPTPTLDFATVEVLNPPWTGEIPTAISNVVTKSYVEALGISADFSTNNQELVETIEASGKVKSVNEKTGDVVLDAGDVSAVSLAFVAPPFTRGVDYAVGDFVEIDGKFYRFNSRWRGSWQSDPIEQECVDELAGFAKVGEAMLDQTFLPLGFGGTNAPAYKKIFTGRSNNKNGYFMLFPDGFSVENTFGGELRVINDELRYYSDGVLRSSMRLADIVTYMAFSPVARGVASNELAIAETARQVASNETAIASHTSQLGQLGDLAYLDSIDGLETDPTVKSWAKAAEKPTYTASEVGAAPASLSSTVNTISGKVSALETWSIGDDTQLRVEHAGATNATLTVLYTNKVMYASTVAESNTLAKAAAYTDSRSRELAQAVDSAIASDAWGERTSSGAPSPADALIIEKPKLALTGGGNFSYIEASTGGYWVMSISLGSKWTLESLADAQNPTNPATVAMHDAEGRAAYTVTSTSSREAYAVRGEQYIYCSSIGGNDVITITYPVVADSAPTIEYAPSLTNEFATVDNWPGHIASVVPSGHSGMWTNTVTMVGHPGYGFFKGKYTKAGHIYTRFNQPIGFDQITLGDVTYNITVETVNGKKLMVLTEVQE